MVPNTANCNRIDALGLIPPRDVWPNKGLRYCSTSTVERGVHHRKNGPEGQRTAPAWRQQGRRPRSGQESTLENRQEALERPGAEPDRKKRSQASGQEEACRPQRGQEQEREQGLQCEVPAPKPRLGSVRCRRRGRVHGVDLRLHACAVAG